MSGEPKLAIVIACYNYESFVHLAIQSVLRQNNPECELIVVDDGSTDRSWDVIGRSGTGFKSFRLENKGARLACLYGVEQTRAPFILFLDADDELKPGSIAKIVKLLDPAVAKLQFPLTRIDAAGNVISGAYPALETFRGSDVLAGEVLRNGVYRSPPTSGNVFRRDLCELLREAHYDKFIDGAMLFGAPFYGDIVSISDELGFYRIHGRNDSGLGQGPDIASIQRDINRYLARMEHLGKVLANVRPGQTFTDPRKTFYFLEQSHHLKIASRQRPSFSALPLLLSKLATESVSTKNKIAIGAFFILSTLLPNAKRKAMLAYRLKTGDRTMLGFARTLLGSNLAADGAEQPRH